MKPIDFILIALIAVVLFFAIKRIVKTKKNGGCGCGCSGCNKKCDKRDSSDSSGSSALSDSIDSSDTNSKKNETLDKYRFFLQKCH